MCVTQCHLKLSVHRYSYIFIAYTIELERFLSSLNLTLCVVWQLVWPTSYILFAG